LLCFFFVILPGVSGQVYSAPPGPLPAKYTLSGTVVNSATGEGVPYALVQVLDRAQLTNPEGEFRFEGLPGAEVMPIARKPGFFNAQERASQNGRGWGGDRAIKLGPDTPAVILKLLPEGVISGIVTGSEGEPVEGVQLQLHYQQIMNGRKQWTVRGGTGNNEDGEFRIANLMPGTYYLSAQPPARRVVRGARPRQAGEGYAPMFYSGAADLASAAPIVVQAGGRAEVSLTLRTEPVFRVSGTVEGYMPGQWVNVQFRNRSGEDMPIPANFDPTTGSFEASTMPPGSYTIRAFTQDTGHRLISPELPLQVRSDISNVHLVLQPSSPIPVVVRQEFVKAREGANAYGGQAVVGGKVVRPQFVSVHLFSLDRKHSEVYSRYEGPPDSFPLVLADAEPGKYRVEITPNGPWYVASAQFGGTDLASENMVIYPGASQPLEVVVRDDPASLDVTVQSDDPDAQAVLLIVPDRRLSPVQQQNFRAGGVARFNGLAPGDYRIYAFDQVGGLEYMNPEVMRDYFPRSARITLHANDNASVHLELIRRGEE